MVWLETRSYQLLVFYKRPLLWQKTENARKQSFHAKYENTKRNKNRYNRSREKRCTASGHKKVGWPHCNHPTPTPKVSAQGQGPRSVPTFWAHCLACKAWVKYWEIICIHWKLKPIEHFIKNMITKFICNSVNKSKVFTTFVTFTCFFFFFFLKIKKNAFIFWDKDYLFLIQTFIKFSNKHPLTLLCLIIKLMS